MGEKDLSRMEMESIWICGRTYSHSLVGGGSKLRKLLLLTRYSREKKRLRKKLLHPILMNIWNRMKRIPSNSIWKQQYYKFVEFLHTERDWQRERELLRVCKVELLASVSM